MQFRVVVKEDKRDEAELYEDLELDDCSVKVSSLCLSVRCCVIPFC